MIFKQPRLALLFWRFGPYHHARLNAAGQLMELSGVEACGMETTYAWDKVEGAGSFTRVTLTAREEQGRAWKQKLSREVTRTLDEIKPQVVGIPGWSSTDALAALAWCLRTNTPSIVMSESTEWDERRTGWKEWMKQRLVRLSSTALAGGTPHADYLKRLGMPSERIFLGYDAVDNAYFAKGAEESRKQQSEKRNKYGLPQMYFLASARFVEKKNLLRLIEAYALYRKLAGAADNGQPTTDDRPAARSDGQMVNGKVVPWSLVLLGDGPLRSSILSLRSSLGLDEQLLLPGFKQYQELPAYYGLASAFVHVSTTEQWGLVVNEAMASGLPVLISNRCGCAVDLVEEGVNGFTFDPCDVQQLARLMLKISTFSSENGCDAGGVSGTQLADFGAASTRIISQWGPERFASGLQQAVKCALSVPQPRSGFIDRLFLKLLLMR